MLNYSASISKYKCVTIIMIHILHKNGISPRVSKLYLELLCKADNGTLEAVLFEHEAGIQNRSPLTIHAITDELFERTFKIRNEEDS